MGASLLVSTVYFSSWNASSVDVLSNIDRDDGTTALVNAILVARADKISTQEASDVLGIDPKLPFMGVSAYQSKRHHESKSHPLSLMTQPQKSEMLWMPKQLMLAQGIDASPALFQSLDIDPSTQFCSDPDDCIRNDDYFKQVFAFWYGIMKGFFDLSVVSEC